MVPLTQRSWARFFIIVAFLSQVHLFGLQAQTCTTPPISMTSWWDGDDISGTAVWDIQGTNDGTLVNGASIATGRVGDAFSLDGIDDYVEFPDDPSLEFGDGSSDSPFTIDAWINRSLAGIDHIIVSKYNSFVIPRRQEYIFKIGSDDALGAFLTDASGDFRKWVKTTTTVGTGWHHVAFTYDGTGNTSGMKLYVNGAEQPTSIFIDNAAYVAMEDTIEPVRIGMAITNVDGSPQEVFAGLIDEVEIFDRELAGSEIQAIFLAGSAGKCKVVPVDLQSLSLD